MKVKREQTGIDILNECGDVKTLYSLDTNFNIDGAAFPLEYNFDTNTTYYYNFDVDITEYYTLVSSAYSELSQLSLTNSGALYVIEPRSIETPYVIVDNCSRTVTIYNSKITKYTRKYA